MSTDDRGHRGTVTCVGCGAVTDYDEPYSHGWRWDLHRSDSEEVMWLCPQCGSDVGDTTA